MYSLEYIICSNIPTSVSILREKYLKSAKLLIKNFTANKGL